MTSSTLSDQEKIAAVAAKLKGQQFYVGQRVRWRRVGSGSEKNMRGTVSYVSHSSLYVRYTSGGGGTVTETVWHENAEPA